MKMLHKREQRRSNACDVVVVGAGLVGASVAARLTREGFDTAILEARRIAGGATGCSTGMALAGLPVHYSWAASVYGRRRAYQLWALTTGGRDRLVEGAKRLGIPVERSGSLALAVDEKEADMLWESAKLLREDGFDASFSLTDPLDRGFRGALHRPGDAMVDAGALAQALLVADDVVVHEGTEVHALEPAGDDVRVWAHGRTVLCSAVVLAVNGYAALVHPYLAEHVAPVQGRVFALEVSGEALYDQPCTFAQGAQFLRPLPGGRVLMGGWDRAHPFGGGGHSDGRLEDFLSQHFPEVDLSRLDHRTEVMGFTADGLPLLGTLPGLPQVYYAVGFAGRGLSWALVAAEQLVDAMLNDADLGILSAERLGGSGDDTP
jgi:glycine/D-amino acid oxidase-like deaminating enzyme